VKVEWLPTAAGANPYRDATKITRLVAEFDNLVLSHADRSRVISDDDRKKLFPHMSDEFASSWPSFLGASSRRKAGREVLSL
jgi:Winged helix DNA-binding domain